MATRPPEASSTARAQGSIVSVCVGVVGPRKWWSLNVYSCADAVAATTRPAITENTRPRRIALILPHRRATASRREVYPLDGGAAIQSGGWTIRPRPEKLPDRRGVRHE